MVKRFRRADVSITTRRSGFDMTVLVFAALFVTALSVAFLNRMSHGWLFDFVKGRSLTNRELVKKGYSKLVFRCREDRSIRLLDLRSGRTTIVVAPKNFEEGFSHTGIGDDGRMFVFGYNTRKGQTDANVHKYYYPSDMYMFDTANLTMKKIATVDKEVVSPQLSEDDLFVAFLHLSSVVVARVTDGHVVAEHVVFRDWNPNTLRWLDNRHILVWRRFSEGSAFLVDVGSGEMTSVEDWYEDARSGVEIKVLANRREVVVRNGQTTAWKYRGHYGSPPPVRLSMDGKYFSYVDNSTSDIVIQSVADGRVRIISESCQADFDAVHVR